MLILLPKLRDVAMANGSSRIGSLSCRAQRHLYLCTSHGIYCQLWFHAACATVLDDMHAAYANVLDDMRARTWPSGAGQYVGPAARSLQESKAHGVLSIMCSPISTKPGVPVSIKTQVVLNEAISVS